MSGNRAQSLRTALRVFLGRTPYPYSPEYGGRERGTPRGAARWARLHATGNRQRISNWRNRRTIGRGRRPRTTQAADATRSSLPVYRDRINPATGRPHRDDALLGRTSDRSPRAATANRQRVRSTLTARDPQYAQTIERAVRDLSPRSRTGRSR